MTISSNSLYGTSLGGTCGSCTCSCSLFCLLFAEALLTSMDSDSSGSVDSTEFSSAALALSTSDESVISDAFASLDGDGDGEISVDELSSLFAQGAGMAARGMPPPPPPSGSAGEEDTGYTAEEITALASEVSETDANLASLLTSISENFEAADANSDGKVTAAEAMAYKDASKTESTTTTTTSEATIADEDALMKALVAQIVANYSTQNSISGSSVSFSA